MEVIESSYPSWTKIVNLLQRAATNINSLQVKPALQQFTVAVQGDPTKNFNIGAPSTSVTKLGNVVVLNLSITGSINATSAAVTALIFSNLPGSIIGDTQRTFAGIVTSPSATLFETFIEVTANGAEKRIVICKHDKQAFTLDQNVPVTFHLSYVYHVL